MKCGLWGMILKVKLEDAIAHGLADRTVADVLGESFPRHLPSAEEFPHLHLDHDLGLALERMGATKVNVLPVVSRANLRDLIGRGDVRGRAARLRRASADGRHRVKRDVPGNWRRSPGLLGFPHLASQVADFKTD